MEDSRHAEGGENYERNVASWDRYVQFWSNSKTLLWSLESMTERV